MNKINKIQYDCPSIYLTNAYAKKNTTHLGGETSGICFSAEKPRRLQHATGMLLRAAFQIPLT